MDKKDPQSRLLVRHSDGQLFKMVAQRLNRSSESAFHEILQSFIESSEILQMPMQSEAMEEAICKYTDFEMPLNHEVFTKLRVAFEQIYRAGYNAALTVNGIQNDRNGRVEAHRKV